MAVIFYENFAIEIEYHSRFEQYYSEITLAADRTFHFWQDSAWGDTWGECLIKSMQSCKEIIADYGFAPDTFQPERTYFESAITDCF